MKYIIDTEAGTCKPYGGQLKYDTIADAMEAWAGAKEWDEKVTKIQTWFYGRLVKDAWCATGLSYFSAAVEKEDQTGKFENVDLMKDHMNKLGRLDCTANYGGGAYRPKRGDVVFMSSKHTYADCTHVGTVSAINHNTGEVTICSCNDKNDSIGFQVRNYKTDRYVVAFGNIS